MLGSTAGDARRPEKHHAPGRLFGKTLEKAVDHEPAQAVAEEVHLGGIELTTLAAEVEGCANVHLDATEHGDGIVFLHAVKDGPANRSYGLQVAQLAGVPLAVVAEARRYLEHLEAERDRQRGSLPADGGAAQTELPLFVAAARAAAAPARGAPDAIREALAALDPDELSPRAALEALYALRRLLSAQ